ncbi:unnamed protein product [Cuscuta europaea]|uniref:Uncharacterized protein n=1 Tax=Cuscuta europaea TaxID=41803 RepID=A0A9P0YUG2_CUSEU|nr:unnamed protein product [Cuscuta europaea]
MQVAEVQEAELQPWVESMLDYPKLDLHNPCKAPASYLMLGDISAKTALSFPDVFDFFTRLLQRMALKSYQQALDAVVDTSKFLKKFYGDPVHFLARSFGMAEKYLGQNSPCFRWTYGPLVIVTSFDFAMELSDFQLMGALYKGNKPSLKVDSRVCSIMEQMLLRVHDWGIPLEIVEFF